MLHFLNEKRHVAAYRYMDVIDEMTSWIKHHVENDFFKNPWKRIFFYTIPKSLSSKINIFSNLNINVNVLNIGYGLASTKYGETYINADETLDIDYQKFANDVNIEINAQISCRGKFFEETFMSTLIHEINHKYEQFKRLQKNRCVVEQLYNQVYFEKHMLKLTNKYFHCEDYQIDYIKQLLYLLFIDTEFHAEIASVYGEVYAFKGDVKFEELAAYNRYLYINDNFDILYDLSNKTYEALYDLLKNFHRSYMKCKSIEEFKMCFIDDSKYRAMQFKNKIEQVYDFYFKIKEDEIKCQNPINESMRLTDFSNWAKINQELIEKRHRK